MKRLIGLVLALCVGLAVAATPELRPDHPDSYEVVKGDTLWDISGKFLRYPWFWPEIWQVNPQIANPHLIYPGDVLTLVYVDGKPQLMLQRGGTVKLSPRIRTSPLEDAIPTIPMETIRPFLVGAQVVSQEEIDAAPYIVASVGEHIIAGAGDRVYVRKVEDDTQTRFNIFRPGGPYIDPQTQEVLGYEAIHVGQADLQRTGDPATLMLATTTREAIDGDRLLPIPEEPVRPYFMPRVPEQEVEGQIISVYDGVTQIGQYHTVVINRGIRDGLEPGHVLAVYQAGNVIEDPVTPDPRDTVQLPDERAGVAMVYRTFDRVSLALIMRATQAIHVLDKVRNP